MRVTIILERPTERPKRGLLQSEICLLAGIVFIPRQEIRNPKLEIRNKSKISNPNLCRLEHWNFGILNLFRISDFEFRISRLESRLRRTRRICVMCVSLCYLLSITFVAF